MMLSNAFTANERKRNSWKKETKQIFNLVMDREIALRLKRIFLLTLDKKFNEINLRKKIKVWDENRWL